MAPVKILHDERGMRGTLSKEKRRTYAKQLQMMDCMTPAEDRPSVAELGEGKAARAASQMK